MSENELEKPKRGWGIGHWLIVLLVGFLLVMLMAQNNNHVEVIGRQMRGCSNARQIIGMMEAHAKDFYGDFPDVGGGSAPLTSNQAFRRLFTLGYADNESPFGCLESPFIPDGMIGSQPEYKEALMAGENHWMLMAGLTRESPEHTPAIFENAVHAAWPPQWLSTAPSKGWAHATRKPGAAWDDDRIIVGFKDGRIERVKLTKSGDLLQFQEAFFQTWMRNRVQTFKILDVEVPEIRQ